MNKLFIFCLTLVCSLGFSLNSNAALNKKDEAKLYEVFAYYFVQEENYKQAIEEYKKVIVCDPLNTKAIYNLGLVYVKINNFNEAIEEFKKILILEDKDLTADSLYNISVVYGKYLNDTQKSQEYYQKYKEVTGYDQ